MSLFRRLGTAVFDAGAVRRPASLKPSLNGLVGRSSARAPRGRFAKRQGASRRRVARALPEDSFRLRTPVPDAAYVVLVDDVVTTGTTLRRAAKALGREDVHRFAARKVL